MQKQLVRIIGLTIAVAFLVGAVHEVIAANAENVFAGKVLVLKKRPPSYFKTKNGFVSFLKNNSTKTLYANDQNEWPFQSMAFFKKPLGDYEVEMVFYDVKNGNSKNKRRFVDSFTQYTQDRRTRSLMGKAILTRPSFDANKDYMVVVQKHGSEVATGFFSTKGTSQAQLDEQKRMEHEMKKMEESMKELQQKAKEQEEAEKQRQNEAASEDLF